MLMTTSVAPFSITLLTAAANPGSFGQRKGRGSRGALPAPLCRKSNPLFSMRCCVSSPPRPITLARAERRTVTSPYVSQVISDAPRVFMIRMASLYRSRRHHSSNFSKGTRNGPASLHLDVDERCSDRTFYGTRARSRRHGRLQHLNLSLELNRTLVVVRDKLTQPRPPRSACSHEITGSSSSRQPTAKGHRFIPPRASATANSRRAAHQTDTGPNSSASCRHEKKVSAITRGRESATPSNPPSSHV